MHCDVIATLFVGHTPHGQGTSATLHSRPCLCSHTPVIATARRRLSVPPTQSSYASPRPSLSHGVPLAPPYPALSIAPPVVPQTRSVAIRSCRMTIDPEAA